MKLLKIPLNIIFKRKKYIHIQQSPNYYTERNETNNRILPNEMYCDQRTVCTSFYIRFTTFTHYSIKSNSIKFIRHRLPKYFRYFNLSSRKIHEFFILFLYQRLKKIYIIQMYSPIRYHSPFVIKSDRSPPVSELSTRST